MVVGLLSNALLWASQELAAKYADGGGDRQTLEKAIKYGFGVGRTHSSYVDTTAGRLLQQTYPVIAGYMGDEYIYPPSTTPVLGMKRSTIERLGSVDAAKDYVELTIAKAGKHVNFIHPSALVGNDIDHSVEDYIEFLDWLVLLRKDGAIKLLTLSQLAIAS